MKVLHGTWSFSLKQINKSTIKVIFTPCVRVLHIDIGCKHDIFMCSKGIAKSFENLEYVKPPNESIVGSLGMFSMMGGYCKANTFNACCTHRGPRSNNRA
jgi:hypothetical protein